MFKLFRQIRNRLMRENKTNSYLLYAIGEIVLVVIGILIALQINTWNGDRIERKYERVLLKKIQDDLRMDTIDINYNLQFHKRTSEQESVLLTLLMEEGVTNAEEPDYNMALGADTVLITHSSAYQNLIEHDISVLKNEHLKQELARLYDFFFPAMEKLENNTPSYDLYSRKIPFFKKHFKLADNMVNTVLNTPPDGEEAKQHLDTKLVRRRIEPMNLGLMKKDEAFKIVLSESIFQHSIVIGFYEDVLDRMHKLQKEIDDYLD